jgi:hypothetical protein
MSKETEFLEWWDDGEVSCTNPYSKGTPIWWAWEGYLVGVDANRTTEESSATVKDSLSVVKECLTARVERATRDNPDLPASFVRSVIEAMDEPLEDATPFAIRESRTVDYKLKLAEAVKAERDACIAIVEKFSRKRKTYLTSDVIDALKARGKTK